MKELMETVKRPAMLAIFLVMSLKWVPHDCESTVVENFQVSKKYKSFTHYGIGTYLRVDANNGEFGTFCGDHLLAVFFLATYLFVEFHCLQYNIWMVYFASQNNLHFYMQDS